jgi:hypothetical protein
MLGQNCYKTYGACKFVNLKQLSRKRVIYSLKNGMKMAIQQLTIFWENLGTIFHFFGKIWDNFSHFWGKFFLSMGNFFLLLGKFFIFLGKFFIFWDRLSFFWERYSFFLERFYFFGGILFGKNFPFFGNVFNICHLFLACILVRGLILFYFRVLIITSGV